MSNLDNEFIEGYLDGRDPDAPLPSSNRSEPYRHSFAIGRNEIERKRNPSYNVLVERAEKAAEAFHAGCI